MWKFREKRKRDSDQQFACAHVRRYMEKLKFWDTEVLRFSNSTMRMMQWMESLTQMEDRAHAHNRKEISVYELVFGLHAWRRQLHLFRGLVAAMPLSERTTPNNPDRDLTIQQFCPALRLVHLSTTQL